VENNLAYLTLVDGSTTWITMQATTTSPAASLDFVLGEGTAGSLFSGHLLWGGPNGLAYQEVGLPDQALQETFSQLIRLPESMHSPTLSFFYRFDPFLAPTTATLDVLVLEAGQEPVVVATKQQSGVDWSHAWADLTPWLGKQVTLQFRLDQPAGEYPPQVWIDEISVSSWTTLTLLSITPGKTGIIPGAGLWIHLHGENLIAGSHVYLDEQEVGLLENDGVTGNMRIWLSPDTPPGLHDLRVVAPSGMEDTLADALYVGIPLYMPFVTR
jgi:hypothetical protein